MRACPVTIMDRDSVETRSVETVYKGHFSVDTYRLRIKLFGGGWSGEFSRELFVSGEASVVILYDPGADALVLVEQFRIAPFVQGAPCWMLEFVAGKVEAGKDGAETARRETREEAGCDILRLEKLSEYFVSPGSCDEFIHLYIGQVDSSKAGGVFGLAEEHEDTRVRVIAANELIGMADRGELQNMNTFLGALWLARHLDALRKRWLGESA